jgi:SAM-dependent methyltransferase
VALHPAGAEGRGGALIRELPRAAGSFDGVTRTDGTVGLVGWMLDPRKGAFDSIRLFLNGRNVGAAEHDERPDVAAVLPWLRRVSGCGFTARAELDGDVENRIDLVGSWRGRARARHSILFPAAGSGEPPLPPEQLQERISGCGSKEAYLAQGLKGLCDLCDQVDRHSTRSATRVLDWGCGSGRLTRHIPAAGFAAALGCDIDGEAIAWCESNLPAASFTHIAPDPPTPYPDSSVDVVCGYSVFTHLSRRNQELWLAELERILVPGGLLLASTHGEFSYLLAAGRGDVPTHKGIAGRWRTARPLRRAGIMDVGADRRLAGVAPEGYYRATFQSREYTDRAWSARFEILDYLECGLMGTQDLVVLRSRVSGNRP